MFRKQLWITCRQTQLVTSDVTADIVGNNEHIVAHCFNLSTDNFIRVLLRIQLRILRE